MASNPSRDVPRIELKGSADEKKNQLIAYTKLAIDIMDVPKKTLVKEELRPYLHAVLEVLTTEDTLDRTCKAIVAHIQKTTPTQTYAGAAAMSAGPSPESQPKAPTLAELNGTWKEREVKIRIFSKEDKDRICAQPKREEFVRQAINKKLEEKGFDTTIEAVRMTAGAESIFAYTSTTKGKSELMERMDDWKDILGERAAVSPQVFPIVISRVHVIDVNPFEPDAILDKLMRGNKDIITPDTKIRKTFWLSKPKEGALTNALVVELMDGKLANTLLQRQRVVWDGALKPIQRFDPNAKITQCHKCWKWKHVQASCQDPQRCGYCSSTDHATENHPENVEQKCANCGKPHPAWTFNCNARKEQMSRVESAKRHLNLEPLFQLPYHMAFREYKPRSPESPQLPRHQSRQSNTDSSFTFRPTHKPGGAYHLNGRPNRTKRFAVENNSSPVRSGQVLSDGFRVPKTRKTKKNTGEEGTQFNPYQKRYNPSKRSRVEGTPTPGVTFSNRYNTLQGVPEEGGMEVDCQVNNMAQDSMQGVQNSNNTTQVSPSTTTLRESSHE